ncbi:MAG: hypothetical protein L0228_03775 [Planctomycetes bacterium]|nr:hypothetical protein [Planctomycetota bacterium]
MGKAMSIAGMVTGVLVAVAFLLDAFLGAPFGGKGGMLVGIGFAISGAMLAYLGWNAFRETK